MGKLDKIHAACLNCQRCSLWEGRTNLVFGDGNPDAEVMFIGEGPGAQEDATGIPFVGRAGKLLEEMLTIIDLDRTNYYIANIVKCRPPQNRDPLETEQDACAGWLYEQIDAIKPKIIICLGRIAAMRLLKPDFKITKEHGSWFELRGAKATAIYHPAALLRNPNLKPDTFDDLKRIQTAINELCDHTYNFKT